MGIRGAEFAQLSQPPQGLCASTPPLKQRAEMMATPRTRPTAPGEMWEQRNAEKRGGRQGRWA